MSKKNTSPWASCVRSLLLAFNAVGVRCHEVDDGGEEIVTKTIAEAVDVITSVDESWVYLYDAAGARMGTLYIVLGNTAEEIICDYGTLRARPETEGIISAVIRDYQSRWADRDVYAEHYRKLRQQHA
jgi:hypothetical protein